MVSIFDIDDVNRIADLARGFLTKWRDGIVRDFMDDGGDVEELRLANSALLDAEWRVLDAQRGVQLALEEDPDEALSELEEDPDEAEAAIDFAGMIITGSLQTAIAFEAYPAITRYLPIFIDQKVTKLRLEIKERELEDRRIFLEQVASAPKSWKVWHKYLSGSRLTDKLYEEEASTKELPGIWGEKWKEYNKAFNTISPQII